MRRPARTGGPSSLFFSNRKEQSEMPPETDDLLLRQVPHSAEAGQAILGSMLIDSRCVPWVLDRVRPEDFSVKQDRDIFDAIRALFRRSLPADPASVLAQMQQDGTCSGSSRAHILHLMECVPTAANIQT